MAAVIKVLWPNAKTQLWINAGLHTLDILYKLQKDRFAIKQVHLCKIQFLN